MNLRRLALLCMATGTLLAAPVVALDDVPDDDEMPAPPEPEPPPPPPRPQPPPPPPPPPPPRPQPPPPPPPQRIERDYEPSGFYFAPEILALQLDNGRTEYATDATLPIRDLGLDTDHELGWRLGLGYHWANRWDLIFRGTHVDNHEGASYAETGPDGIDTVFDTDFQTAAANMDVDYTTIDAEVGYTWGAWERSHLRLFFGPRLVWIDQELNAIYDPDTLVAGDRTFYRENQDMDAWGLRVGVEGNIAFGPAWALILLGGVGLYDADFDNVVRFTPEGGATTTVRMSGDDTISSLEASISLRWQRQAFQDGMFGIRFGWELTHWNDVPTLMSVSVPGGMGDDFDTNGPFLRFEWIF